MSMVVTINGKACDTAYRSYLAHKEVEIATVKKDGADVYGSDGIIDYTELPAGRPTFNNRAVVAVLLYRGTPEQQAEMVNQITADVHGNVCTMVFGDEPTWIYRGRCEVSWEPHQTLPRKACMITITMDGNPYKEKNTTSTKTLNSSASGTSNSISVTALSKIDSIKNNSTTYAIWVYVQNYPFKIPAGGTLTNLLGYMIPAGSVSLKCVLKDANGETISSGSGTATMILREVSL